MSYAMGKAAGGGGSGDSTSYYTPIPNTSVVSSLVGLIVRHGNRASFCGRVQYVSAVTANRLVMTVPDEIKPAGYYIFTTGNGGKTSYGTGFIGPDGNVYVSTNSSRAYDSFEVSWDIPTSLVNIGSSSIVTNTTGKICIAGGYASLSVLVEANPSNAGWQSEVLVIPDSVKPTSPIGVFSNYGSIGSAMKDCIYVATTGGIDIYLPSGAQTFLVQTAWVVGA